MCKLSFTLSFVYSIARSETRMVADRLLTTIASLESLGDNLVHEFNASFQARQVRPVRSEDASRPWGSGRGKKTSMCVCQIVCVAPNSQTALRLDHSGLARQGLGMIFPCLHYL